MANLPNSAQLNGIPYHYPKLHLGFYSSVGMRRGTDRQTHRPTHSNRRPWPIYFSPRLCLTRNVIRSVNRNVILLQPFMPTIRHISSEFFIIQHSAPAHMALEAINFSP